MTMDAAPSAIGLAEEESDAFVPAGDRVCVTIAGERFTARFLRDRAPETCARFAELLPYRQRLFHVRWSGEACWIPLGGFQFGVGFEDATSHPAPGEVILYPGGLSETEILIAYGAVRFASKAGQLAGNPFLKIEGKLDRLAEIGRSTLANGACEVLFE